MKLQRYRSQCLVLSIAACALTPTPASADSKDFVVGVDQAFINYSPASGTTPYIVDIENKGANARGVLRVFSESFEMEYPVELPRGSHKRIFTYPKVDRYFAGTGSGLQFQLDTDQGSLSFRAPNFDVQTSNPIALISDSVGELGFLRQRSAPGTAQRSTYDGATASTDAYAKPDQAPPRPAGYDGMSAVILGAGSERISDDAVRALRLWTLSGGTLVFVGGASAPGLKDPRWQEVLPVTGVTLRTAQGSSLLSTLGGSPMRSELSVSVPTPVAGSSLRRDGDQPMIVERPFGLGRVLYFAFNPFEAPLNRWAGRRALFETVLDTRQSMLVESYLSQFEGANQDQTLAYMSSGPGTATYPVGPGSPYGQQEQDPFSTTLPTTSRVFTILVAYFVVVVPLNFLILRKLKHGEWAWITSPLISAAFAGAFLSSAGDLYAAKLSRATRGLLVAREGLNEGMFVGRAEMFFPRGGSFDLGIQNADSVDVVTDRDRFGGPTRSGDTIHDLNPIDDGSVHVSRMAASNLTFKQLAFRQIVGTGKWFTIDTKIQSDGQLACTVRNNTSKVLTHANVVMSGSNLSIPDLRPGQSVTVTTESVPEEPERSNYAYGTGLSGITSQSGAIAVVGDMNDLQVGPQLGNEVPKRTSIRVAYFASEANPRSHR